MRLYFLLILNLLPLCAMAQIDSILWQSIERTYLLHLPAAFDDSQELPLVIAMHGGFGNANNIENQSQLSAKADDENFIVVYPEGVKAGVFNIRTWNAGWCCGHASASNIDDVGFINALIDTLIKDYPIDINRVYATGMSNGGYMSYRLACELSDRIAAIAPVAASMSMSSCNPNRAVPVMDFHSYLDTNVPYQGGTGTGASIHYSPPLDSVLNVWSQLNACTVERDTLTNNSQITHIVWSSCDCNNQVEQYITQDGGHSWPGGRGTLIGDEPSDLLNATDLMWDFFTKYSLDCLGTSTLENEQKENIIIYPNPTKGILNIDINDNPDNLKVLIYNALGKQVLFTLGSEVVDIRHLSIGPYFIKIDLNNTQILRKIIKVE